jgi:hypothetical protein
MADDGQPMEDAADAASRPPPDGTGAADDDWYDPEYAAYDALPRPPEAERSLSGLRVRQLAAERRATYRARSYYFIGLGECAVAAAQLVLITVRHVRHAGWQLRPVGYVCGVLAAAVAAAFFYRRAADLTRELRNRPAALDEPQAPPDFSTLSDGSHYWKNLQEMSEET